MARIGDMIGGEYEILRKLESGGMGNVYVAMKKKLNKTWCVKELIKDPTDERMNIKISQAFTEAKIMAGLKHDFLPSIVDVYNEKDALYIVMDYIEGDNLKKVLDEKGAQSQDDVMRWAKQLAKVLIYLHSQNPPIIYRDMKPQNIMLKPDNDIKLIDFGVAKEYKEEALKDTHMFATNGYAAPEQSAGGKTDARTDIYSLGVTLFYLLTNKDPQKDMYVNTPIREINPELSGGLENIILKCTKLNPDERYQNAEELLYALENYQKEDDAYKWEQKRKLKRFMMAAIGSVVSFVVALGSLGVVNLLNRDDYEHKIFEAESAISNEEKARQYGEAIAILPDELDAYYRLIDTYKVDNFTIEEEEQLKKILTAYQSNIQDDRDYGRLAFEIGKLYWYYYDYGQSSDMMVKATGAQKWFEDAVKYVEGQEYYSMADAYSRIGKFYSTVTQHVAEADDTNMYKKLYNDLNELYKVVEKDDNQEIVQLESGRIILNSLSVYARKMKNDGISKEEMTGLLEKTLNFIENVEVTTDKTEDIKNELLGSSKVYYENINNAFEKFNVDKE